MPGSFTLAYEVFHEDDGGERVVYLRGQHRAGAVPLRHESPRRLTAEERAALEVLSRAGPAGAARSAVVIDRERARHYPVQVRFSDVDVYRHVNNVVYFEYFQEARIRMFMELGRGVPRATALQVVIAQADVDYLAPILLRADPYDCRSQIAHVGRTSLVIESEIADGDRPLARARVVLVFFDPRHRSGRPEPPAELQSARLREAS